MPGARGGLGLYDCRLADAADARDKIAAIFDLQCRSGVELAYRHGFRGCGMLNAAAELPADAAVDVCAAAQGTPSRHYFETHLREPLSVTAAASLPSNSPSCWKARWSGRA